MKNNKYNAIIFDMDGTIIDTEHIWKKAIKDLLAARGIMITEDHSVALQAELRGTVLESSCFIIKHSFSLSDNIPELMREKALRANMLYKQEVQFMQGFVEFHKQVQALNIKTGLATNATHDTVVITNHALNLKQFFGEHIYSIASVNNVGKPHPAIYLHAAEKLAIDPESCIAIEDSPHGLTAAKAAGMYCIGFNSGKNKTLLSEAHTIVDAYTEIDLTQLLDQKKKLMRKNSAH